jgi:geranylgeranyl diphosphate synthase type I
VSESVGVSSPERTVQMPGDHTTTITASRTPAHPVSRSAGHVLAGARTLVDPALRAAVATLPPAMSQIAGYHFGWQDHTGTTAGTRLGGGWGKAVRSALVLGCAQAVGGRAADAIPAAVAVELVHNASLLHDDIIDGDSQRRHRPTVWAVFGKPAAILAGDALFFLSIEVLADGPAAIAVEAITRLTSTVQCLIDGEHADTLFEQHPEVSIEQCLNMATAKTAALIECACTLGALYGKASSDQVNALGRFGGHLGLAFQLADDLLGIWGDSVRTGKPGGSDLRNRKKTLPVITALTSDTPAGRQLAAL